IAKQLQTIILVARRLTTQRVAIDTDLHRVTLQQPTQSRRPECGKRESSGLGLKRLKSQNVVIKRIVPIRELFHIRDQVVDDATDVLSWMKAQNVSGLFETHLVVPYVLDMFYPQPEAN